MFYSSYSNSNRGVAILFKNSIEFEVLQEIKDKSGNFILLEQRIACEVIYGPNRHDPSFYENVQRKIELIDNTSVLIGGDWNIPLIFDLDTENYKNENNPKARDRLHGMIIDLDLIGIWRSLNPDVRRFTWREPG